MIGAVETSVVILVLAVVVACVTPFAIVAAEALALSIERGLGGER